ncbi:MAG: energy-coupling factor ABC transporter ATP-binding protein, partial [Bacteroidota bacterium]
MNKSIISIHHVTHEYSSGERSLDDLSLELPRNKKIALMGCNGAGKSTLMLMLNGILRPAKGKLSYDGEKYLYKKKFLQKLRARVGFLFDNPDDQLIAPTVFEEISFGLKNISGDKDWVRRRTHEIIKDFHLESVSQNPPHDLSAGQKKMVCLAAILAMEPEVLVCDEPASGLDPRHEELTFRYLNKLHERGKTILISTHDVNQAYDWADYVIILNKGKVVTEGEKKEVLSNRESLKMAGMDLPFLVEASYCLDPELKTSELPATMSEFKNRFVVEPGM